MSAGMLEAIKAKLNNSANAVDFLMTSQSRGIMVIIR